MQSRIEGIARAVGILYVLTKASDGTVDTFAASTFSLYEVRGKHIGITVIHLVGSGM
jgi:hypothetical protein